MIDRSRLIEIGVLDGLPEARFDHIVQMAARSLGSQVSLFSIIDEMASRQFFKSAVGLPPLVAEARQTPLSDSFCKTVVADAAVVNVSDARVDPRFQNHPAIDNFGVVAYLGAPVTAGEDQPIGALCAIAETPREWSEQDELTLTTLAAAISEIIAHRITTLRKTEAVREYQRANERFRDIAENIPGAVIRYMMRPDGTNAVECPPSAPLAQI